MNSTQRGTDPSTDSSRAQISGTAPSPMDRAAVAGKVDTRSSVAVNRIEMMSSSDSPLRSRIRTSRATTRSVMASLVSTSTVVAPRTALMAAGIRQACYSGPSRLLGAVVVDPAGRHRRRGERPDLVEPESAVGAGGEGGVAQWPDAGADEP